MTPSAGPRVSPGDLLSRLEDLELPLLSWGVTDGALSEDEVLEAIDHALAARPDMPAAAASGDSPGLPAGPGPAVPGPGQHPAPVPHAAGRDTAAHHPTPATLPAPRRARRAAPDWWQAGRRLVADYRLHAAARRYPRLGRPRQRRAFHLRADCRAGGRCRRP